MMPCLKRKFTDVSEGQTSSIFHAKTGKEHKFQSSYRRRILEMRVLRKLVVQRKNSSYLNRGLKQP